MLTTLLHIPINRKAVQHFLPPILLLLRGWESSCSVRDTIHNSAWRIESGPVYSFPTRADLGSPLESCPCHDGRDLVETLPPPPPPVPAPPGFFPSPPTPPPTT